MIQIIDRERKALLLFGHRASGKSTFAGGVDGLAARFNAQLLDPDMAKVRLPEYGDGIGDLALHSEASSIVDDVVARLLPEGRNFVQILDGFQEADVTVRHARLKKAGYEVHVVFLDLSAPEAARRAVVRWKQIGAFVDPDLFVNFVGGSPQATYDALLDDIAVESLTRFSSDVPRDSQCRFVESRGDFARQWFTVRP